jgi:hypothetical protein
VKGLLVVSLTVILVLALLPGCKSAEFEFSSIFLTPDEIIAGEVMHAEVTIRNTGGAEGVYTVRITFDGQLMESRDVILTPGATENVSFTLYPEEPEKYTLEMCGQTKDITVLRPAEFVSGSLSLSPDEIVIGETANADVLIKNTGEARGVYTADIILDGQILESRDLVLEGGISENVSFTFHPEEHGKHTLDVCGQKKIITVLKPAEFEIDFVSMYPDVVSPGEEAIIKVRVDNIGEATGTYSAVLTANEIESGVKEADIAGGEYVILEFVFTADALGTYDIKVAGKSLSLFVTEPGELTVAWVSVKPCEIVIEGQQAIFTAIVRNDTDFDVIYNGIFKIDGVVIISLETEILSGQIVEFSFPVRDLSEGLHILNFGDKEVTFEVTDSTSH